MLPSSRPGTPLAANISPRQETFNAPVHPLHPAHPIATPQQFYDWFAVVEQTISHSQEAHFRNHLETVQQQLARCEAMRNSVIEINDLVQGMLSDWRNVEEGAENLQAACERLLEERDRLIQVTEEISVHMEYYEELEHATRMLNHPGDAVVLQADFLLMVERVDVCIEYFQTHRHFVEADIYLLRFQQCMTRAMTLIKIYFVGSLKSLASDAQRRMTEQKLSATAEKHILYSKFGAMAGPVAPLLAELERRAMEHPDELASLLSECHTIYFSVRKSVISGRLSAEIKALDPANSNLVELTRSGCSYLKQLCAEEFELYCRFFNSGEEKLYRYLESLCDYLYDDLRPRILHEPSLLVLCQVCTVLQALMILDTAAADKVDSDDEAGHRLQHQRIPPVDRSFAARLISLVGANAEVPKPLQRLNTAHLLQMILQDARTRLFFKAQAAVQAEIRHFAPSKADLDYPGNISSPSATIPEDESVINTELFAALSYRESRAAWYPTLRKLHWVLSLLHDFVDPAIFEDMAGEAIGACRHSLFSASQLVAAQSSELDAQLFLIRHLMILKEMTSVLDAERVEGDARPVGPQQPALVTEYLGALLRGTSSIFGSSTLFGGLISLGASTDDSAKLSADEELKRECETLINMCAERATQPLRDAPWNLSKNPNGANLAGTAVPIISTQMNRFLENCENEVRAWVEKLRLYLEDARTVGILVAPMQANAVSRYEGFRASMNLDAEQEPIVSTAELWDLLRSWCGE
ncbi:Sec34-like family-domain-containing protein [Cantharellus anzutake]|uniref:Sec34-like family-domain-containing protein n=1 Tax=Cantharellus anzutake TaxID=1750568 RepID=UPI0019041651|nr:Sec34-like family-domain-containing protein [Cantharellus anzutake]KAF8342284.1 Sec34-like family-domain-containing protein [Cantharellus anzutake]